MKSIVPFLSSSLGRRDETANIRLAEQIVQQEQPDAIEELVRIIQGRDRKLGNDAIKTLYEIGERAPKMILPYLREFIGLLSSKVNRLQWGSMTAISTLVELSPQEVYSFLPQILQAMERGSVITKDHGVKILVHLATHSAHRETVIPILLEFIQTAPLNQFPSYVLQIEEIPLDPFLEEFLTIIRSRLPEFNVYPAKEKKLLKVLKNH